MGGRRRTSRSAVARKACVRDAVGRARGSGGTNARVSVFFIHIHPRLRRAGRRRGGKADRSVQRPVILVRCVGHGGGARGVGAVGRHARGGASGTGRAGQRGERCAGAQNALRSCGLRLAQRGDRSRHRGRQPSASRRFGRGESHAHPFERGHKGQGEHKATADVEQQRHHAEEGEALQ